MSTASFGHGLRVEEWSFGVGALVRDVLGTPRDFNQVIAPPSPNP
jgi:hypothetical protein